MASIWTNKGVYLVMSGQVDLDGTTGMKMMLLKNTLTPAKTDNFASDISAHECTATNYTGGFGGVGRKALTSRTVTEDDTNNRGAFDAADLTWTALGGGTNNTLRHTATIVEITSDAASPVLFYNDMGADQNTNGSDFSIVVAAAGLALITT